VTYLAGVIAVRGTARVMFAGSASQGEFLAALGDARLSRGGFDWSKVTVFLLDDYISWSAIAPPSEGHALRRQLIDRLMPGQVHELAGGGVNLAGGCARYAALLAGGLIDLICLGIDEDGGLGGNGPLTADFEDPETVRSFELGRPRRQRLVDEGRFPTLEATPRRAVTVTLPVIRRAHRLCVVAPGPRCAGAVRATLHDAITTACPATMLRLHPDATLYLDPESAALAFGSGGPLST
jgi:glucosamine-6-phosphate deaminase